MNTPEDLRSQVRMYTDWAQQMIQDHGNVMSEKDTETKLVEPVLDMLNWDPKNINVRKGYRVKTEGANYEADYALMIDSRPRILIEVKKVANNLSDENVMQLMKYAFYEKADIFILTNGNEWRVYEPYHLKDMVFKFGLDNMENNLDCLWLLSRDSIRTGLLDQELDRRYAIEKVYGYIEKHKGEWVSDIERVSKKFTEEGISRILDIVIMSKDLAFDELSPKPPVVDPQPPDVKLVPITDRHTGKFISSFWFNGSVYEVDSWRALLLKLSSIVYSAHADEFDKVLTIKGKKRPYYTRNRDELVSPLSIPETDIFVEGNVSANRSTQFCSQLIAIFGYSDDDLKVEVHGVNGGNGKSGEYTLDGKFSGQYAHLRPVFDAMESKIMEFGNDIKLNVRKAHTAFVRKHSFVMLRVTKQAIGMGLSLDESVEHDRLRDTPSRWGGWSRVSRNLSVSSVEDIDDQLVEWMKQSYDRS